MELSDPNAFLLLQNRAKALKNVKVMIQWACTFCGRTLGHHEEAFGTFEEYHYRAVSCRGGSFFGADAQGEL